MVIQKIAISGKANSGKNTVAELLMSRVLSDFATDIFAFADPIKSVITMMYPQVDHSDLWGPSERRSKVIPGSIDADGKPLTLRQALLDIGKLGRSYNKDTWINATLARVDMFLSESSNKIAMISDLRFKNEMKAVKNAGFFMIRVVRPSSSYVAHDISEVDLDDVPDSEFDVILANDGSYEDLLIKVDDLAQMLLVLKA